MTGTLLQHRWAVERLAWNTWQVWGGSPGARFFPRIFGDRQSFEEATQTHIEPLQFIRKREIWCYLSFFFGLPPPAFKGGSEFQRITVLLDVRGQAALNRFLEEAPAILLNCWNIQCLEIWGVHLEVDEYCRISMDIQKFHPRYRFWWDEINDESIQQFLRISLWFDLQRVWTVKKSVCPASKTEPFQNCSST